MRASRALLLLGFLGCSWAACRETIAAAPEDCPGDSVAVVAAGSSGSLRFSWAPACPMASLIVQTDSTDWTVQSDSDRIMPPVQYGRPPGGATVASGALPLVHGDTVTVSLWRTYSAGLHAGPVGPAGTLTFVY